MNLRNTIEVLSRGVVLSKQLHGILGRRKIYVSPEAGLRYWKPGLKNNDNMMLNVISNYIKSNTIVWDIGANLGLFSFNVLVNFNNVKCLMLEPDIWLCHLIRKSALKNKDWNIDILPLAVSNTVGLATFNIANRSRQTNFLSNAEGSTQTGGIRHTLLVPTTTMDKLSEDYNLPDFIKIDVEGAEALLMEGAINLLKKCKPIIMCECSEKNFDRVRSILGESNYDFLDAEAIPQLKPFNPQKSQNFIAIPKQ